MAKPDGGERPLRPRRVRRAGGEHVLERTWHTGATVHRVAKRRMGERDVSVERDGWRNPVIVRNRNTKATARCGRFS